MGLKRAHFEGCVFVNLFLFSIQQLWQNDGLSSAPRQASPDHLSGYYDLSILQSAGLGNAVADLVGTAFQSSIESAASRFMPPSRVSPIQMESAGAWWAETAGASIGVTCGCLLGLLPLFILGRNEPPSVEATSAPAALASCSAAAFPIAPRRTTSRERQQWARASGSEALGSDSDAQALVDVALDHLPEVQSKQQYLHMSVESTGHVLLPTTKQQHMQVGHVVLLLSCTLLLRRVWQIVRRRRGTIKVAQGQEDPREQVVPVPLSFEYMD